MIGNVEQIIHWLFNQDKDKLFEIKENSKHRTLTQNSYAWHLINELANKLNISKEDMDTEQRHRFLNNTGHLTCELQTEKFCCLALLAKD